MHSYDAAVPSHAYRVVDVSSYITYNKERAARAGDQSCVTACVCVRNRARLSAYLHIVDQVQCGAAGSR